MWTSNGDDELKNKLKYDIIFFYKNWYMGDDTTLYRHLELFEKYYDPRLFNKNRSEAIIRFMTFLQDEVNRLEID